MTLLLALSNISQGQFLHTHEEMEEMVNSRPDKYLLQETDNLSTEAFESCRGGTNNHNVQAASISQNTILQQKLNKSARKKLKKKNKRILKHANQTNDNDVIRQLCANHFQLGNFDEALYYKLLLPSKKTIDFEDEFLLAKSYFETKNYKLALEHAFNAKLTLPYSNQSDLALKITMIEDLLAQSLIAKRQQYSDWALQFAYCITNRDNKTYISFKSEPWKTYAVCKSVWQEDEDHKKKMATVSDQAPWLVEEKECLLNALVAYMHHEENNPEFIGISHLADALNNNYIKEFIQYEVYVSRYLPNPDGIPSKAEIAKLRTYFLKAHSVALK